MAQANNNFTAVGRLTKDAQLRGGTGKEFLTFNLAIDRPPKRDAQGKLVVDPNTGRNTCETDFPYFVIWNSKQALGLVNILGKGSLVSVMGQIRTNTKEDASGVRTSYQDNRVEDIKLLVTKKPGENSVDSKEPGPTEAEIPASGPAPSEEEF